MGGAGLNLQAAQVNVAATGQLGEPRPAAAGPNVPAAKVNVPATGQLGQAPLGMAGPNVPLHGSTSLLPDDWDTLPRVRLLQMSLLPDNSERLPWVWLVQTSLLPDSSDRLPWVMFLQWVRMYLFNLVMILCTHKWYMIVVHQIMTLRQCKCYQIHCIMALQQSKTTLLPGVFVRHTPVGPQVTHFLNHQPLSGFSLLTCEIQIGALYLAVGVPCVLFMSCPPDMVWHYPSLKGIR